LIVVDNLSNCFFRHTLMSNTNHSILYAVFSSGIPLISTFLLLQEN